jgi:HTH-type transcriptional regulator/antitoxin HigA
MNKKHFVPFEATPVGGHIKDELDARGIKQKYFAKQIGIQASQFSEIINGKRGIDTELANLIGMALGINPLFWLNLQSNYELNVVKTKKI